MRPFLARFSEPVWSGHLASWADFITTTPELEFSVDTTAQIARKWSGTRSGWACGGRDEGSGELGQPLPKVEGSCVLIASGGKGG
jgi:hypothetical protein